jgi:hypothetical protein
LDVCGTLGITCTLSVHLFALTTIACHLIEASLFSTTVFLLLYTPLAVLALASLYMAWATDPGAVPMGARPLVTIKRAASAENQQANASRQRALRRCHKCNDNFKPSRAHHDSVTGRCIGESSCFLQSLGVMGTISFYRCLLDCLAILSESVTHHCPSLSYSTVKFDHFCPWVGNAVGAMNHKFFVLFVGYTMCTCILSLFLIFVRALHCGWAPNAEEDSVSTREPNTSDIHDLHDTITSAENTTFSDTDSIGDQDGRMLDFVYRQECHGFYNSYATLVLLIVSVVFMIFTCCMMCEQIEAIQTNSSKIARMKMRVGQAGTELARVTEEFNEMFGGVSNQVAWHWFLPLEVEFPRGMKKVVLGYEWDETFDPVPYEEPSNSVPFSGMSAGGGSSHAGVDEEGGSVVELTSQVSSSSIASTSSASLRVDTKPAVTREVSDGAGEEAAFSGTPVLSSKLPQLIQRGNSRGQLKPAPGTLT